MAFTSWPSLPTTRCGCGTQPRGRTWWWTTALCSTQWRKPCRWPPPTPPAPTSSSSPATAMWRSLTSSRASTSVRSTAITTLSTAASPTQTRSICSAAALTGIFWCGCPAMKRKTTMSTWGPRARTVREAGRRGNRTLPQRTRGAVMRMTRDGQRDAGVVFSFLIQSLCHLRQSVWWFGRRLWASEGPPCCPTAVLAALLHAATAAFWLLWRGDRTVERALGTVVLSGVGSVQYAPALVDWESTTFSTTVCNLSHFGSWANPGFENDRVAQRLKAWKLQKAGRTHRVHTKKSF